NNRIRALQTTPPALQVSPSSLTFNLNQDGPVSDVSTVGITGSSFGHLAGVLFTTTASQPWISVAPDLGTTPATLQVTVDPSGLAPKTYNESITINAPGANPPLQKVAVNVIVSAPPPPS